MNNAVRSGNQILGYRCHTCGGVFDSMWDVTCNGCRSKQQSNDALLKEIKLLREQLSKNLQTPQP